MADIILPDDVFENMQHAQEAAEKMNAAVNDFNKKVDEKFKGEDASNKAKFKQKINPILSPDEKKRYRNIGNAFFEGAKNQIIDIFKQIEENKKKGLFSRAAAAVKEKVQAIKDAVEEHKTGGKILLAIAAIGGIYMLFKGWFDKNMPEIWEKMKEAVTTFANGALDLANKISEMVSNSGILETIKNLVSGALEIIGNFFTKTGEFFLSMFNEGESGENKLDKADADAKNLEGQEGDMFARNLASNIVAERANNLSSVEDNTNLSWSALGNAAALAGAGVVSFADFQWGGYNPVDWAVKKIGGYDADRSLWDQVVEDKFNTNADKARAMAADYTKKLNELLKAQFEEDEDGGVDPNLIKMLEAYSGADAEHKSALIEKMKDMYFFKKAQEEFKNTFQREMRPDEVKALMQKLVNMYNKKNKDNAEEAQKEAEKQRKEQEQKVRNVNGVKLVDVAVITSLDEFVKNFFDGDKPGSFKYFSDNFIKSFKSIISKLNTFNDVLKNVNGINTSINNLSVNFNNIFEIVKNIPEHVQHIIDKIRLNATYTTDVVAKESSSIQSFIKEKVEENIIEKLEKSIKDNGVYKIKDYFDDIIKYEKEQTETLSEQNKLLKETNTLLSNVGNKNNSFNIINPQNEGNNIDVSNMPNATTVSIANAFVTGEMPFA